MVVEYKGQKFMTDNYLRIIILGSWPRCDIQNKELAEIFQKEFGRTFLGGDEIISYAQPLVYGGMDFSYLENLILEDIKNPEKPDLKKILFNKTASGIGRGHSLGGLSGVVLGIHGTKMIDSGLTGLVASRSLVTSSRRRETTTEEIMVPETLFARPDLLDEYLEISRDVFKVAAEFKEKFGKLGGVETFNKVIPYNNPADLFIVLPLDTLATLAFEVRQDKLNPNGNFVPRELHRLVELFPEIAEKIGIGIMYKQRINVPRDTYFHYTIFKDPSFSNYALEEAELRGMPIEPLVIDHSKHLTDGFKKELGKLREIYEKTMKVNDPEQLEEKAMEFMLAQRNFVGEYNEAIRGKILDRLSWRVWSEQKRHATLRQNVESVYSAEDRSIRGMIEVWPLIKEMYEDGKQADVPYEQLDKIIMIDDRLKKKPELVIPYLYHTGKQLMFSKKLKEEGFERRDRLYSDPKNIILRTLENYDLINLIDLEHPLRLCKECEPERYITSWKKREALVKVFPELDFMLQPKCIVGYCTEATHCKHITDMRKYDKQLHKDTKRAMLAKARK